MMFACGERNILCGLCELQRSPAERDVSTVVNLDAEFNIAKLATCNPDRKGGG